MSFSCVKETGMTKNETGIIHSENSVPREKLPFSKATGDVTNDKRDSKNEKKEGA